LFSLGTLCARTLAAYCPYYSPIWTAGFFFLSSVVGLVAAKSGVNKTKTTYIVHLIATVVAVVVSGIGILLAAKNWMQIGTLDHPMLKREHVLCLLGEHDPGRIRHIELHMGNYNFSKCLLDLKFGLALNTLQAVITAVLALLQLVSMFLSLRITCSNSNSR